MTRLVIAMLTFRRPADLRLAVPAFLAELDTVPLDGSLLVVDNDPDGSAAADVAEVGDVRTRYVHEPEPGIAAGRNRALDEVSDADLVVFVDDDEHPEPGWLRALLATREEYRADCVVGAVVSEFAEEPEPWIAGGRFFDRRRLPTGTRVDVAATNNLLLDTAAVRARGLRFDPVFGLSGGSDTLFTRRLATTGATMVWCDEAVVVDRVPSSRLTRRWVLHRARRSGNSAGRVSLVLAGSPARRLLVRGGLVVRGSLRVLAGLGRRSAGRLSRSLVHDARGARSLERGVGMLTAALGRVVYEYTRA